MKTYVKLMLRSLKSSASRFIAIMAIVCVGVAFLTGLTSSTPDMYLTLDTYYKKYSVYDIDIKSTLGFTDEDIQSLKEEEYIENVTGLYSTDVVMVRNGKSYVVRIFGVPFGSYSSFEMKNGRIPEDKSECLAAVLNPFNKAPAIGDIYTISE